MLPSLKGGTEDDVALLDNVYKQLSTSFDESPESIKPQAVFLLASMALERKEFARAKQIKERLEKVEGPNGRHWRYIEIRLMLLTEKDPDFTKMREIQDEVAKFNPDWDQTYILKAMIEEKAYETFHDPIVLESIIAAYRAATRRGNLQAEVWQKLAGLLENAGRPEEAKEVVRMAALSGVVLQVRTGQLPQPFGLYYSRVQESIAKGDATEADTIARHCIELAEQQREKPELIFTLNLILGKIFLDALMFDSAERHLTETAKRGGTFAYPLAACLAKSGKVDKGFELLLDEITHVPSAMPQLMPAILVLLAQYQPSEEVFLRIDKLIERIENNERLTISAVVPPSDEGNAVPIVTGAVPARQLMSIMIRFTDRLGEKFDPELLQFIFPGEKRQEDPSGSPTPAPTP
jgi:tetratricopeptide (TPR) repeat protein